MWSTLSITLHLRLVYHSKHSICLYHLYQLTYWSNQLEWGALVKDAGSFKLSSSISEAQRDTLTRIQFKTAAYLRRLAQPLRCFV